MWRNKQLVRFLSCLALWYGLGITPWPGFNRAYGAYFRAVAGWMLAEDGDRRVVRFEQTPEQGARVLDTRIVVASRESSASAGGHPAKILGLDSRAVGWVPTALVLALILSTPVPWSRRGWSVVGGWLAIHLFILFSVAVYVLNETGQMGGVSLDGWPAMAKAVVDGLDETLITQMGASFVVPVAIWVTVTFRSGDFTAILWVPEHGNRAAHAGCQNSRSGL
jgi:hypothetical protein